MLKKDDIDNFSVTCTDDIIKEKSTFSQKIIDIISTKVNSLVFFIGFVVVSTMWIIVNSIIKRPIDPYPYLFLGVVINLVMSIQNIILGLHQRRQDEKSEIANRNEYKINKQSNELMKEIYNIVKDLKDK